MEGKLMILDKNECWKKHCKKLLEECLETIEAIEYKDNKNIVEESLDVIQVIVGILDKASKQVDIKQALMQHEKKLINRGWKCKGQIHLRF